MVFNTITPLLEPTVTTTDFKRHYGYLTQTNVIRRNCSFAFRIALTRSDYLGTQDDAPLSNLS